MSIQKVTIEAEYEIEADGQVEAEQIAVRLFCDDLSAASYDPDHCKDFKVEATFGSIATKSNGSRIWPVFCGAVVSR